jgi:hypothetical protein
LLVAVLPVLLHWPHLTGWLSENPAYLLSGLAQGVGAGHGVLVGYPGWIDGNAGVTTQALGGLAARDWLRGVVPWWNPFSGVGLPLAAELQNSAFFLPFVLLLRAFDGVVYLKIVLQVIAGLSCLGLLRALRLSRVAALVGAACFELNGSFAWFAHGPIMPIAFLPMLLFGIERARAAPWQGGVWVGVAIGWSLLAGFPEVAYLDGLLGLGWALVRVRDWGSAVGIVVGGVAGLLVAAPPLLAFVQSLPISFLGSHVDAGGAILAPANRAGLLFPYLFGPPLYGGLHLIGPGSLAQFIHWYRTSAYLDLPLLGLALMAVRRGENAGLRWLLAGWLVAALGRAIGVPGLGAAVNAVPLVRNTMFFLYIMPSCQLAATVLAGLTIDDWRRRGRLHAGRVVACVGAAILLGLAALPAAWPELAALRSIPGFWAYPIASVLGGCGCAAAAGWLLARPSSAWAARALAVLLVGEAAALCFLPLLAGTPRPRGIDHAAVAWLTGQQGLFRVHAVASLTPNYGAWFGIGATDDNYLPVPQTWVDDVRATLLPGMDGVNNSSVATDPAALAALRARVPALEAHGVRYLLMPPGVDPFAAEFAVPLRDDAAVALPLSAPVSGTIGGNRIGAGRVERASVTLGTYGGTALGALEVRVCQRERCGSGQVDLATAVDNTAVTVALKPAVDLVAGEAVTYEVATAAGRGRAPAMWLWPLAGADAGEAVRPGLAPRVVLGLARAEAEPLVYADGTVGIFRLPDAAPLFEAAGCALAAASVDKVSADCARPARMVRRELAYPGWRAWRDGRPAAVGADGIYQAVWLPAGVSHWRFAYAPPFALYAWLASACGGLMLAVLGVRFKARPGALP